MEKDLVYDCHILSVRFIRHDFLFELFHLGQKVVWRRAILNYARSVSHGIRYFTSFSLFRILFRIQKTSNYLKRVLQTVKFWIKKKTLF